MDAWMYGWMDGWKDALVGGSLDGYPYTWYVRMGGYEKGDPGLFESVRACSFYPPTTSSKYSSARAESWCILYLAYISKGRQKTNPGPTLHVFHFGFARGGRGFSWYTKSYIKNDA